MVRVAMRGRRRLLAMPAQLRTQLRWSLRTSVSVRPQRSSAWDEQGAIIQIIPQLTAQERLEQIKVEVSNQLALANAQELVNVRCATRGVTADNSQTLTNKCYKACVTKPSTSLSSSEERCLERCQGAADDAAQLR